MEYEFDDTASNPLSEGHLPVSGEIDPNVSDEELNPDIADDMPR